MLESKYIDDGYSLLLDAIEEARQSDQTKMALLIVRIGGVNTVNETTGHLRCNTFLEEFRGLVNRLLRPQDCGFRISGHSIAILIRHVQAEGNAELAANKIVEIARKLSYHDGDPKLNAQIGIAVSPDHNFAPETLIAAAKAMLKLARDKEVSYRITEGLLDHQAGHGHDYRFDLGAALKGNELTLHYQPKVDLRGFRLIGAEGLLRWNSPEHGNVAPGEFLSQIEPTVESHELMRFTLHTALRQLSEWSIINPKSSIAINATPNNLAHKNFFKMLSDGLAVWNIEPSRLTIELTESDVMGDPDASVLTIRKLRESGVKVAIDDFGTGYSSLAYLRDMQVNEVKLDRSFIEGVDTHKRTHDIVTAMVQLIHSLGIYVVAEGIETESQAKALQRMGCDIGQGYLFSAAVSSAVFETTWLVSQVMPHSDAQA